MVQSRREGDLWGSLSGDLFLYLPGSQPVRLIVPGNNTNSIKNSNKRSNTKIGLDYKVMVQKCKEAAVF